MTPSSRFVRQALRTSAVMLVAATSFVACTAKEHGGARVAKNDLRRVPPGVERATIQPLGRRDAAGNALLEVQFEPGDKRIADGVTIFPEPDKKTVLRDDGRNGDAKARDGIFSAVVDFDFQEVADQAAAVLRRDDQAGPRPIFRGRELIGVEDPAALRDRLKRLSQLREVDRVIRDRLKIDLFDLVSSVDPAGIDPTRSLMVTDPSVVQDPSRTIDPCTGTGDPNGKWTFKHLVTEMVAGTGVDPADFVEQWLLLWDSNQTVSSGFVASPRPMKARVLDPWPRVGGKLDLDKSPFRLAAIVNRIDLGDNLVYGGGSAGEGRFVFGVWDRTAPNCQLMPFSVIFEYGVTRGGCHDVRDWAKQWVALSSMPIGTPAYNQALELITEQFAKAGAAPDKPNGSALNQLRTNENALNVLWELREFHIDKASHLLFEDTTKQTPDETLNNSAAVASYVNTNAADIKLDKHVVPDHFPAAANPFMAATSRASPGQTNTHFSAPGIADNDARFHFSLNTCTACHIRETSTNGFPGGNTSFLHVDPRPMPAALSRFLTGSTPTISDSPDPFPVSDPVGPPTPHLFNDLDRRRQKLAALAGSNCFRLIVVPPRRLPVRIPRPDPEGRLPQISDLRLDGVNDPVRMTH